MRTARLFISSPADVAAERKRLQRVVDRLNGEFADIVTFETIRWETSFYSAHAGFQEKIPEARDCDLVIAVLWSRLGTPLPPSFGLVPSTMTGAEPEPYPSGTAYEILSSLEAHAARQRRNETALPEVFVFRKLEPPTVQLGTRAMLDEAQEQWERLEAFFQRWFLTRDGNVLRAFHSYGPIDEFERACEGLLRNWIKENVSGAAAIVWPIAKFGSPFRGLAAFDARHAPVFFGRDRKVARAIELLKKAAEDAASFVATGLARNDRRPKPFLLVVGPSGAGKSSLARAGIVPRLTAPGVVPDIDFWRVAVFRPSDRVTPVAALANALLSEGGSGADDGGFGPALPEIGDLMGDRSVLADVLARSGNAKTDLVLAGLDLAEAQRPRQDDDRSRSAGRLLILVDQLEDIFSAGIDAEARSRFASALSELAATGRVWILATVRGDLYERLITERGWLALKDAGTTYDLARPGPDELDEILRKSAAAAGLRYESDVATGISLDRTLLADASGLDSLPLLQFTLNSMFAKRETRDDGIYLTCEAYRSMGGLDGAIDQAAENALASLSEIERAELPRLLRLLAVPVEHKDGDASRKGPSLTVRPVSVAEAKRNPAAARLVDELIEQRILLAAKSDDSAEGTVQIAHQRVLESWKRARTLIAEHQDFYRIRDDVEQQYRRWREGQMRSALLIPPGVAIAEAESVAAKYRDEMRAPVMNFIRESGRRARWRLRFFQSAAAVFALVALAAVWQRNEARTAQNQAQSNYETARGTVDSLIASFAERLSQMEDISIGTVETAYAEINKAIEELGKRAAADDPTFDATRGSMALSFAGLYKKTQAAETGRGGSSEAVRLVNRSIDYFERLVVAYPKKSQYKWSLASALKLYSDLIRGQDLAAARTAANKALNIVVAIADDEPHNGIYALTRSQILTRLGDMQALSKDFREARSYYEQALDISLEWYPRNADAKEWARELTWTMSKIGEDMLRGTPGEATTALALFERELCVRRRLLERDEANTLFQTDVSWSLDRVGRARQKLGDFEGSEKALLEALRMRRDLLERDQSRQRPGVDKTDNVIMNDLYRIVRNVSAFYAARNDNALAYAYLTEAREIDDVLYARRSKRRTDPGFEATLKQITDALAEDVKAQIEAQGLSVRRLNENAWAQTHQRSTSETCWAKVSTELAAMAAERQAAKAASLKASPTAAAPPGATPLEAASHPTP